MFYPYNRTSNLHLCDFSVRDSSLWKTDGKYRTALRVIFGGNRPALSCYNHLAESQSNPVSCSVWVFPTIKPVKQAGKIFFFIKACAADVECNLGKQGGVICADNLNLSVVACAFHAVFEDVLNCFRKPSRIALDKGPLSERLSTQ